MESFRLKREFFETEDTHQIARGLLGKALIRKHQNGRIQAGIIVEVESYHGLFDHASHASKNRTKRNEVMFGSGGHYYVYLIYGMYWNLNIVTGKKEFPSAILIRSLEPIYDSEINLQTMTLKEKLSLASGPGKLCRWMEIDKSFYGKSVEDEGLFVIEKEVLLDILRESGTVGEVFSSRPAYINLGKLHSHNNFEIVETKRIGVEYAGESADLDWRYYIKGNKFVSKI